MSSRRVHQAGIYYNSRYSDLDLCTVHLPLLAVSPQSPVRLRFELFYGQLTEEIEKNNSLETMKLGTTRQFRLTFHSILLYLASAMTSSGCFFS